MYLVCHSGREVVDFIVIATTFNYVLFLVLFYWEIASVGRGVWNMPMLSCRGFWYLFCWLFADCLASVFVYCYKSYRWCQKWRNWRILISWLTPFWIHCTKSGHVAFVHFEDMIEKMIKSAAGTVLFTVYKCPFETTNFNKVFVKNGGYCWRSQYLINLKWGVEEPFSVYLLPIKKDQGWKARMNSCVQLLTTYVYVIWNEAIKWQSGSSKCAIMYVTQF